MKSSLDRNDKELYDVMREITRTLRLFKTNRELAIPSLTRFLKVDDPEALDETFRSHAKTLCRGPVGFQLGHRNRLLSV